MVWYKNLIEEIEILVMDVHYSDRRRASRKVHWEGRCCGGSFSGIHNSRSFCLLFGFYEASFSPPLMN